MSSSVYLRGQFRVAARGDKAVLTTLPRARRLGDCTRQGRAFFSGTVAYHTTVAPEPAEGERVFTHVPRYRGVAVRVLVNATAAGVIAWKANVCVMTALLHPGANTLSIEILGHRRNSHTPLHHTDTWPSWTAPAEFVTRGNKWTDAYQLVPCGLLAAPRLVIRR